MSVFELVAQYKKIARRIDREVMADAPAVDATQVTSPLPITPGLYSIRRCSTKGETKLIGLGFPSKQDALDYIRIVFKADHRKAGDKIVFWEVIAEGQEVDRTPLFIQN